MKRSSVWAGGLLIVIGLVAIAVRAQDSGHNSWGPHAALGCTEHELGLSTEQRARVNAIWAAEKPTVARLMTEFARENRELQSLTAQENPDPKRLQSIADLQGATFSELVMEKEKLMMQFKSQVLKPKQRAKVEAFGACLTGRIDEFAQYVAR